MIGLVGFDVSQQTERDTEVLPKSDLLPQGETALMRLQQMVDSTHTNNRNTSPLAAQQSGSPSLWGNSQHVPQPIELGGLGSQSHFQSASHDRVRTQQLTTGSDADVSPRIPPSGEAEGDTKDSTRSLPHDRGKIWLKRVLVVISIVAAILFIIVVVLLWQFVGSNFFRHF